MVWFCEAIFWITSDSKAKWLQFGITKMSMGHIYAEFKYIDKWDNQVIVTRAKICFALKMLLTDWLTMPTIPKNCNCSLVRSIVKWLWNCGDDRLIEYLYYVKKRIIHKNNVFNFFTYSNACYFQYTLLQCRIFFINWSSFQNLFTIL